MQQKSNIQQFDEITAQIFAKLYEAFPLPISVECIKLTKSPEIDDLGMPSKETEICLATLNWLNQEGYINFKSSGTYFAQGIVLTSKGLSILKTMPESLESQKTLGERIQIAIKAGAITTAVELLKLVFSKTA